MMLVMLFMVLSMMMLVVVLFAVQVHEVVHVWSLFVGWHHVLDKSDTDVLTE